MVYPFWFLSNDTATPRQTPAEVDIARRLNAEKDREIERIARQLESHKKARVHSNTQRRTSPILWRLYLASLQNLMLRNKQSPFRKHHLPPWCCKTLWYRRAQRNCQGPVTKMILVRPTNPEKGASVLFQTRNLQLFGQPQESTPTHGLSQATPKSRLLSKHDWDSRSTPEVTMISGSITSVSN
jgi:hypothetical protein